MRTKLIAEIGVNHNGDLSTALDLVRAAKKSGIKTVKFQLFKPEGVVTDSAPLAKYQEKTRHSSQLEMLSSLSLHLQDFIKLRDYCHEKNIEFLVSVFDTESFEFALNKLKIKSIKIASGEISNIKALYLCAKNNLDVILSTGGSNLSDIEYALSVLVIGYKKHKLPNSNEKILDYLIPLENQKLLQKKVTLLHCVTDYPARLADINLSAIQLLKNTFGLKVGYSDHTMSNISAVAAVILGAVVIEKHITLDKSMSGPDHSSSITPEEFKFLKEQIVEAETLMNKKFKTASVNEVVNRNIVRRKIMALKEIKKGQEFTLENIDSVRSEVGLSASKIPELLGQKSLISYEPGQIISEIFL